MEAKVKKNSVLDIESDKIMHNYLCNYTCPGLKIFSQESLITFAWLNETAGTMGRASGHGRLLKHPLGFSA